MITNISIATICTGGHHADISFQSDSSNILLNGMDYDAFFSSDYSDAVLADLKYLLNQYEHSDWQSLKTALEA